MPGSLAARPLESLPRSLTEVYCPRDDPFDGYHSKINASFSLRRHNEIQRVLKDYTKKCPSLPEQAVQLAFASTFAGMDLVATKRVAADISIIVGVEQRPLPNPIHKYHPLRARDLRKARTFRPRIHPPDQPPPP